MINNRLLQEVLEILDVQREYWLQTHTPVARKGREAYYRGLLHMLSLVVSDGYRLAGVSIEVDNQGKHYVASKAN